MSEMHWARWGDPQHASPLGDDARALVDAFLGTRDTPAVDREQVRLGDALGEDLLAQLRSLVGADHVATDDRERLAHTRGKSTPDLLLVRAGDGTDSPDAVVSPADADEVQLVIDWCVREHVALVPFGGGTSVVGGLTVEPGLRAGFAGVIALDLARLDRLVEVDEESMTAVLEPGLRGPQAEAALAEHGLTLGHFPQSFEYATIGGFAATRSSGQSSAGYGRFDALVVGLEAATPRGPLFLGTSPANAAGPDLRQWILGSEGAFGVVTAVRVRVRRRPQHTHYERWRFADFPAGATAMRGLAQAGLLPTVLRLSDESETAVNLAEPDQVGAGGEGGGCLLVVGYEGTPAAVAARRDAVTQLLTAAGGTSLGEHTGWSEGRFEGPYLRDSLLDVGVLVETLETVSFWSRLTEVYDAVRAALADNLENALVLCHISHVYETGASLYFTVAAPQSEDPVAQWHTAKSAATDALVDHGASVTHHHAIGRDHRPWLQHEVGDVGLLMLRAVKDALDPTGVLNPGVLVP